MIQVFSWIVWSDLVSPKSSIIGLGLMVMTIRPENHENNVFRFFGQWKVKFTTPKWSRIILRSFWATVLSRFTTKVAPKTPPNPKCGIFLDFHRFSIGIQPHSYMLHSHRATYHCGSVALCLCSYAAIWLCGCVAMFQNFEIPKCQSFEISKCQRLEISNFS